MTDHFSREEKKDKKTGAVSTSIKESLAVSPGRGEKNDTERKTRVASELGNFSVMMDFGEFLAKSDTARRDFVYSLSPIDSRIWTREKIADHLANQLLTLGLKTNNYEQYLVMHDLINKAVAEYPEGFGVQEGLQAMIDWVSSEKSLWDRKQKDAQGAVRQISDMKNDMAETDRNIAALKEELEQLQQQLVDVEKRLSADMEKKKALDKRNQRITELRTSIAELEVPQDTPDTSEIDNKINALQAQIQESPAISDLLQPLQDKQAELKTKKLPFEEQQKSIRDQIATIKVQVSMLEDAIKQVDTVDGRCVIHRSIGCNKDFGPFHEAVNNKKAEAISRLQKLQEEMNAVNHSILEIEAEEKRIARQLTDFFENAQAVNSKNAKINAEITALNQQKNKVIKVIKESTDRDSRLKLYCRLANFFNRPRPKFCKLGQTSRLLASVPICYNEFHIHTARGAAFLCKSFIPSLFRQSNIVSNSIVLTSPGPRSARLAEPKIAFTGTGCIGAMS